MFGLDVELKFWELLFALAATVFIVVGAVIVFLGEKKRRTRLPFYVDAGGVTLSVGEERLLEAIAQPEGSNRRLKDLAPALGVDELTAYAAASLLLEKGLITEVADQDASPRFELSSTGNDAALARGFIKLL